MNENQPTSRRRQFLGGLLGAGSVAPAGCSESSEPDSTPEAEKTDPGPRIGNKVLNSSFPVELVDPETDVAVANIHWHDEWSHWHFTPVEIPLDDSRTFAAYFNDRDREPIPLGPDEAWQLTLTLEEGGAEPLFEFEIDGIRVTFWGLTAGEQEIRFRVRNADEFLWTSAPLRLLVE
jgi:hypothetical protein